MIHQDLHILDRSVFRYAKVGMPLLISGMVAVPLRLRTPGLVTVAGWYVIRTRDPRVVLRGLARF